MNKLKCYYAHPMYTYGSTIEQKDLELLNALNFEIVNPNCPEVQIGLKDYIELNGVAKTMEYFADLVSECDMVAFRALPDGRLLSGVAFEVQHAKNNELPVIELPRLLEKRMMNYPETKEYLTELGFYKAKL